MFCINLKRSNSKTIKISEIGSPTDFKVIQHIGLSRDRSSFEVVNIHPVIFLNRNLIKSLLFFFKINEVCEIFK